MSDNRNLTQDADDEEDNPLDTAQPSRVRVNEDDEEPDDDEQDDDSEETITLTKSELENYVKKRQLYWELERSQKKERPLFNEDESTQKRQRNLKSSDVMFWEDESPAKKNQMLWQKCEQELKRGVRANKTETKLDYEAELKRLMRRPNDFSEADKERVIQACFSEISQAFARSGQISRDEAAVYAARNARAGKKHLRP